MSRRLFTTGYEGADIETFIARLKGHAVNCVLDVREIPLSRKRGFSKTALRTRLDEDGISYIHLKALGSPKPVRDKLKNDHDYKSFFASMEEHLFDSIDAIETAYDYVTKKTCCLLCFEQLAAKCHRKVVARKIKDRDGNGLKITNI